METSETRIHSFVIRLWQEDNAAATTEIKWRGHITHILGDERRTIENLDEIKRFIEPYISSMNLDTNAQ